ncbi:hypothetical protein [Krasilnikovia cinnamomea]|uniref:hypothetical protein n=1 Tax=Krasilnikovia cinnamomea TaxID=349313 RepID=UPI0013EEFD39|nr:hypothetical protein [Krasilnikovia cinnamomea]
MDDRDHLHGQAPEAVLTASVPLTALELVAALYCRSLGMEYDYLAEMSDAEVRRWVAHIITFDGINTVHRDAQTDLLDPPADPGERAFLALCERRVATAFGITVRPTFPASIPWVRSIPDRAGRVMARLDVTQLRDRLFGLTYGEVAAAVFASPLAEDQAADPADVVRAGLAAVNDAERAAWRARWQELVAAQRFGQSRQVRRAAAAEYRRLWGGRFNRVHRTAERFWRQHGTWLDAAQAA